jgi:hypothetical protein
MDGFANRSGLDASAWYKRHDSGLFLGPRRHDAGHPGVRDQLSHALVRMKDDAKIVPSTLASRPAILTWRPEILGHRRCKDKPERAGSLSFDVLRQLFDYGFMRLLDGEGTAQPSWPSGRRGLPMIHHLEAHWQLKQAGIRIRLNHTRYRKRLFPDPRVRTDREQIDPQLRGIPEFLVNRNLPIVSKHSRIIGCSVARTFRFYAGNKLLAQVLVKDVSLTTGKRPGSGARRLVDF